MFHETKLRFADDVLTCRFEKKPKNTSAVRRLIALFNQLSY